MVSKPEYNSLQDAHLAHHFRKPVVFRHLLCMGLVTPEGKVLTEREWKNSQRIPSQEDQRTPRLLSLASEGNLRPPIGKRKGVAGEPYLDSLTPFRNLKFSKIYSIRSARGTQITKCSQVWERLCPPPNYNISISSWRRMPPTPACFRLQYIGKIDPIKVLILQQPSGVNSIPVFSGTIHPQEEFGFTSCRARDAAFSLVIYEDDLCTSRVNTCCERRYYPGRKLGGPGGHFLVTDVKGGVTCTRCENAMPVDSMRTSHLNGSVRKPVGTKITIDVQLAESDSEKIQKKERLKKKSTQSGQAGSKADSENSSPSDLKSVTNEDTDDDIEDNTKTSQASESYEESSDGSNGPHNDSSGSHSDSNSNENSGDDSPTSKTLTSISRPEHTASPSENSASLSEHSASPPEHSASPPEHSEEEIESKYEDDYEKEDNDDENLSNKNDTDNDDYSSDFTSSHSTIKEQIL